jgi:hypothetical protein
MTLREFKYFIVQKYTIVHVSLVLYSWPLDVTKRKGLYVQKAFAGSDIIYFGEI